MVTELSVVRLIRQFKCDGYVFFIVKINDTARAVKAKGEVTSVLRVFTAVTNVLNVYLHL